MNSKFKLLSIIPLYKLSRTIGWPKMMPINLTYSVSNTCNSRCKTCNIWQKKSDDLNIFEWEKILKNVGKSPYWITISGGEPFLKNYLVDFVKLIYKYNQPAIINIPTNAILSFIIPQRVEEMIKNCSKTQFIINISVDGVGQKHDEIRQVKGNFEKVIETFNGLKNLKERYDNLNVGFHTVISNYNVEDLEELFDWVFGKKPDQYIAEIAEERVELDTVGMDITPSLGKFKKATDLLGEKLKSQKFKGLARITEAFRKEYYKLVKKYLADKKQPIPCFAGRASGQIYCDGMIWPCCVRADNLGNLREYDYNFKKIWFSKRSNEIRKSISNKECACPLANAAYTNMLVNFKTLIKVILNLSLH